MNCPHCGIANPVNTLYCNTCGNSINLTPEQVQMETRREIARESDQAIENICRNIAAVSLVIYMALSVISARTDALPDPDLVAFMPLPEISMVEIPLIEFPESVLSIPKMEEPEYSEPNNQLVRTKESQLRKEIYSIDNVVIVRKPPKTSLRGRILRETKDSLFIVDPRTTAKYNIKKSDGLEIRKGAE